MTEYDQILLISLCRHLLIFIGGGTGWSFNNDGELQFSNGTAPP